MSIKIKSVFHSVCLCFCLRQGSSGRLVIFKASSVYRLHKMPKATAIAVNIQHQNPNSNLILKNLLHFADNEALSVWNKPGRPAQFVGRPD